MKISSRSLLSPGRPAPRDQRPITLSTSLSRRLKNSRSIKGGASPALFPKKRGGFDNPEPSSPKVTCIGQVRVKSKKKHHHHHHPKTLTTSLSKRRTTTGGDVTFRKLHDSASQNSQHLTSNYQNQESFETNNHNQNQNQRWVHLPFTICEALRTLFGSEFSCLFPCRSSCSNPNPNSNSTLEKQEEKMVEGSRHHGSCGAVFARWLVAFQEGDGGNGRRQIELVAGDENDVEEEDDDFRDSRRHHVFEDLEIVNDVILGTKDEEEEEEGRRVSICVPPKNALLLMRCRSDPVKMEALTSRFWEPTFDKNEEEEDEEFVDDKEKKIRQEDIQVEQEEKVMAFVEASEPKDLQKDAIDEENVEKNSEMETKQSFVEEERVEQNSEMETKQIFVEEEKVEKNSEMETKQSFVEEENVEKNSEMETKRTFVEEENVEKNSKMETKQSFVEEEKVEKNSVLDTKHSFVEEETMEKNPEMETKHSFVEEETVEKNPEMETKESVVEEEMVGKSPEMDTKQTIEINEEEEEESMFLWSLFEENADEVQEEEDEEEKFSDMVDVVEEIFDEVQEEIFEEGQETQIWESTIEKVKDFEEKNEDMVTEFTEGSEPPNETHEEDVIESKKVQFGVVDTKNEENDKRLPECLLLMLYEPKLSMEVSKETWVCSTDFIRHRSSKKKPPQPPPVTVESIDGQTESIVNATSPSCAKEHKNQVKPARSSCSFPANMLERKLGNTMGIGYEPLVLTRCKSEPMRTTSTKLAPETCFWKNKLEPPRRASFGITMAGLGF